LDLIHIKLKNGHDLIGMPDSETETNKPTDDCVWIVTPICVDVHPIHGLFGRSWLMLAEGNTVKIDRSDIMYISKANDKAKRYYSSYIDRFEEDEAISDMDDDMDELEEIYTTMQESKISTKH